MMTKMWIVVASAAQARIYKAYRGRLLKADGHDQDCLQVWCSLEHEPSRRKVHELVTDKVGNYRGSGAYVEATSAKEHEVEKFAKQVADVLEKARVEEHFNELIIVAAPHFSGLLYPKLARSLKQLVSERIEKDYTHLQKQPLIQALQQAL
jgi:protein required for attachment to host cells